MACEICGRSSCTRCFHSLSEQDEFDTKTGRYAPEEDAPQEAEVSIHAPAKGATFIILSIRQ